METALEFLTHELSDMLDAERKLVEALGKQAEESSRPDLQKAFEQVWPARLRYEGTRSLDWFFDGWVNGTAIPDLALEKVSVSHRGGKTIATARLLQRDAPSELVTSVPIYAVTGRASQPVFVARVFADGSESDLRLAVPAGTRRLLLDPYNTVLRRQ